MIDDRDTPAGDGLPAVQPRIARPRRTAGGRPVPDDALRIAAIDIGSNSIRQILADVSPDGTIQVVDEMKAMPRLGKGVDRSGALAVDSMADALSALARMATLARQMGADRIEAVATSAVRDAANGGAFLDRVREETGLRVRLLTGEEEARLSFRSALAHFELGAGRTVVMDIGGGSLELALAADGLLDRLESFPFGAIRATEQFLAELPRGGAKVEDALRQLRRAVRWAVRDRLPTKEWRGARVIGSGGTFTNLAGLVHARAGLQAARTRHGTVVTRPELTRALDHLATLTPEERAAVPGLNPARADIIVAGFAVAAEVMSVFEARELQVSGYGIREGLLLEAAAVTPTIADPGEARERSVRAFAERCHYEEPHAEQVRKLALQLFDQLGPKLGAQPGDREVLADAALLHDVGYHISHEKHHKHSYHLILHADLLGMTPAEQVAVANVARYHRGPTPRKKHDEFARLDRELRRRVVRLAALLRVADGLDRGHAGAVDHVGVRWAKGRCVLSPVPVAGAGSLRLELWGADRKSELLCEVLDADVELVAPDGATVHAGEVTGE
ncbi:Ppx/GppA phosphatase family protein [Roseisolibacter sp. H3M3-2]|uniref:Ppx/GppA phosphatase family protein n=1 Tax=Roseisolibacter sp. H3M3-2 TaxID=3031323 RepID=UPI0023DBA3D1|nr:Ppx/GppA phosphatase family protein [Roseisolibacter sp. H3M3-2]MDF1503263.1 Ppx/GppA phosphatase family protein [Roseisolibacter sp. H3M3-2]